MKIAFYSPIKPPDHPVPSGDRTMAWLLMAALRKAGHEVVLASRFRSYSRTPDLASLEAGAAVEIAGLIEQWAGGGPDLWFSYHPYYKAPDLIGPAVCRTLGIPYVTAEASFSSRRQVGEWAPMQAKVVEAVKLAGVNFCMTPIDRQGLAQIADPASLIDLPAFIDTSGYGCGSERPCPAPDCRLITVAMMRPGVKVDSFEMLAAALGQLPTADWRLAVVGDGSAREHVEALFSGFGSDRISFHGQLSDEDVREQLMASDVFVWPGHGEAYGLAYLEAQAAGLPVVAQATHGVPSVVVGGETGILTPAGDVAAYGAAIAELIADQGLRARMAAAARRFVFEDRNLAGAARILDRALGHSRTEAMVR